MARSYLQLGLARTKQAVVWPLLVVLVTVTACVAPAKTGSPVATSSTSSTPVISAEATEPAAKVEAGLGGLNFDNPTEKVEHVEILASAADAEAKLPFSPVTGKYVNFDEAPKVLIGDGGVLYLHYQKARSYSRQANDGQFSNPIAEFFAKRTVLQRPRAAPPSPLSTSAQVSKAS